MTTKNTKATATETTETIANITLMDALIKAIRTKTSGTIDKTFKTIQTLPIMEQYYLIKGFKTAKNFEWNEIFRISPLTARAACEVLLTELYYFGPETNEITAYEGMGNIKIYVEAMEVL